MFLGVLLVGVGIVAIAVQLGILPASIANLVWPMLAIFVGVWLLMGKKSSDLFGPPKKKR